MGHPTAGPQRYSLPPAWLADPLGISTGFLLWVFIAQSAINVFNFTVAALGSSKVFRMGTCRRRCATTEQVYDWHTVRQKLFPSRQLKRLLRYHLHPSFIPHFTSLCSALQNSLEWVGIQTRCMNNYGPEVKPLCEPVSLYTGLEGTTRPGILKEM